MPYFVWRGVALDGSYSKGLTFARSEAELQAVLFDHDIAYLASKQKNKIWWLRSCGTQTECADFFRNLKLLLSSGVFLGEALQSMSRYQATITTRFQEIIVDCTDQVQQGYSLSAALARYPNCFDPMTIALVRAGEETGSLERALESVCHNLALKRDIYDRVKTALLMPGITALFFVGIMAGIFGVIMPRFMHLFTLYKAELPPLTNMMLRITHFVGSWHMVMSLCLVGAVGIVVYTYTLTQQGKRIKDMFLVRLPYVGHVVRLHASAGALRSLALLVGQGMPLVNALHLVAHLTSHTSLYEHLSVLEQEVARGVSLSTALMRLRNSFFPPEVISAISVGEKSGQLGQVLEQVSAAQYVCVKADLITLTTLLQPILMVLLGLLIALLVFAVYMPILGLASSIK